MVTRNSAQLQYSDWLTCCKIKWMTLFNFAIFFLCSEQFEDPLNQHIFDDDENHHLNDAVRTMIISNIIN